VTSTVARADDVSSLKAELADLKAKVAAMESSEMAPAAGGDAESLTSLKKKGSIKIGGNVEVAVVVKDRDDASLNGGVETINGEDDEVLSTEFRTYDADLTFDVAASKDMGLRILLDLDDMWDEGAVDQDDLLEECYFYWKHVGGSNWQLNFGKKEVPFGMDKNVGLFYSYAHGGGGAQTTLFAPSEANVVTAGNAHNRVGNAGQWMGEIDNVFQVEAIYTYKDLAKFYASLFQNRETTGNGRITRGMHEDRSDDTLFFQSFAVGMELTPLEDLTMLLTFVNEHVDSYGDESLETVGGGTAESMFPSGNDAEDDTQAISFGVDYKFKSVPVEVFGEYIHQWNWAFDDEGDADIVNLGVIWGVTENVDLGLMGDYANIDLDKDDGSLGNYYEDQDFWAVTASMTYKFSSGIYATLEYRHEWFDGEREELGLPAGAEDDIDADADAIAVAMGWNF